MDKHFGKLLLCLFIISCLLLAVSLHQLSKVTAEDVGAIAGKIVSGYNNEIEK